VSPRAELWREPGWLPTLEIADWPRLAEHRKRHEDAVNAVQQAEDAETEERATLALCGVVEAALRDLGAHLDEAEVAYREAAPKVEPKRPQGPPRVEPEAEQNARAEKVNAKLRAEAAKLAPQREALERDLDRLRRVRRLVAQDTLSEGRIIPAALAQVEAERAAIGKRAAKRAEAEAEAQEFAEKVKAAMK
jgi:hypothetical protein